MRESRAGGAGIGAAQRWMSLAAMALLAGCAGRAAPLALVPADTSSVSLSEDYALPAEAMMIGHAEGVSCAPSPFAPKATQAEAIERLKQDAARMGARGVMHMRVATVGITPSCWYSYVAEGTAYR